MYIFMGDETNRTASERNRFFIYGGLFIPAEAVEPLDRRIGEIRAEAELRAPDPLKFDTRSRPEGVSIESYTEAKNAVIDACVEEDVQFAAYLILHDIARGGGDDLLRFALNSVLSVFDHKFLAEKGDYGVCVVDRFGGDHELLQEKFQRGIYMDGRDDWVRLNRIKLFATTCDGASHLSSAVDIVLGAFRYCVNEDTKTEVPRKILPRVVNMMFHRSVGETIYLRDYGLVLRPQHVRKEEFRAEYDRLVERLGALIREDDAEGESD